MSDDTHAAKASGHSSSTVYLIVGGFLVVLTAMEISVFYVHALRPVMVPVLIVLGLAKFALIAMFFMHLRYEKWMLNAMFLFPLTIATAAFIALLGLFGYLAQHAAFGAAFGLH